VASMGSGCAALQGEDRCDTDATVPLSSLHTSDNWEHISAVLTRVALWSPHTVRV